MLYYVLAVYQIETANREDGFCMKAVITVVGADQVGILAKVSGICAEYGVNVLEVSQNILGGNFAMIMLADAEKCNVPYSDFIAKLTEGGNALGVDVRVTRQEVFDAMHRI